MSREPAWLYPSRERDRSLGARIGRALERRAEKLRQAVPPLGAIVRECSAVSGKSSLEIASDVVAAWRHERFTPRLYASFRLWGLDAAERAAFVRSPELDAFLRATSDPADRALLLDKVAFAEHARDAGVPIVPTLAVVNRREGLTPAAGIAARDLRHFAAVLGDLAAERDLILKPAIGKQGIGVFRVARGGRACDADGRPLSASELGERVFAYRHPAGAFGYVVQPLLASHRALVDLVGWDELATLRVITAVSNGRVEVVSAFLKLPAPGRLTNNFRGGVSGSLLAAVDPSSGRLGDLVGLLGAGRRFALESTSTHPSTGNRIEGNELPGWREALEVASRGALAYPRTATLGWDIAYAATGWHVLEVNTSWGCGGPQIAARRGLRESLARLFPEHWRRDAAIG